MKKILAVLLIVCMICSLVAPTIAESQSGITLQANVVDNSVKLKWESSVSNVKGFNLYRSENSGETEGSPINDFLLTDNMLTDNNVQIGKTYYYICKAVLNDGTELVASNEVVAKINPDGKITLHATVVNNSINLQWESTLGTTDGYNIYRSEKSSEGKGSLVNDFAIKDTKLTDNTAQIGRTYYYTCKAVLDDSSESAPSNEVKAKIEDSRKIVLKAKLDGSSVVLDWDSNINEAKGYNLYRTEKSGVYSDSPINDFQVTGNTLTDKNIDASKNYFYICKPVLEDDLAKVVSNEVTTKASKGTYIYDAEDAGDTIVLPKDELKKVNDKATAVSAIDIATKPLVDEQKQSASGMDKIAIFAEEAIAKASETSISGSNIEISNQTLEDLVAKALETKSAVEDMLVQNGVNLMRDLRSEVSIKSDQTNKVTVKVDNNLSTKADSVKVETPFAGVSIDANSIKAPVAFTVEGTSTQKVSVKFDTNTTTTLKVSFPGISGDAKYKAVVDENGKPIGGKYNPVTNELEAKIKASGIYSVVDNEKDFDDIKGKANEMQEAIKQLASKGIISGKSAKTFAPDDKISRAEIAALIVRALSKLDPNENGGFTDVANSSWYFGVAGSSKKSGIISGYPDNTFKGQVTIPKDQIMVVTARVLQNEMKYKVPDNMESYLSYTDRQNLAKWSTSGIALATQANLVVRRTDGNFVPNEEMTRGDAAIVLKRLFDKVW